jgi:hypothetical protein
VDIDKGRRVSSMMVYGYKITWANDWRGYEQSIQCWSDISMKDAKNKTIERANACGWTPRRWWQWWQWWRWCDTVVERHDERRGRGKT